MRVAVVGAGLAGLAAAREVVAAGHEVVLKSRGLGGRLAARRAEGAVSRPRQPRGGGASSNTWRLIRTYCYLVCEPMQLREALIVLGIADGGSDGLDAGKGIEDHEARLLGSPDPVRDVGYSTLVQAFPSVSRGSTPLATPQ